MLLIRIMMPDHIKQKFTLWVRHKMHGHTIWFYRLKDKLFGVFGADDAMIKRKCRFLFTSGYIHNDFPIFPNHQVTTSQVRRLLTVTLRFGDVPFPKKRFFRDGIPGFTGSRQS